MTNMILLPGTDLVPSPSWHVQTKIKANKSFKHFLDIEGAWLFLILASLVGNMIGSEESLTRSSPLPWNCQLRPLLSHQRWLSTPRPCGNATKPSLLPQIWVQGASQVLSIGNWWIIPLTIFDRKIVLLED